MKVLAACEESQSVTKELRALVAKAMAEQWAGKCEK